MNELPPDIQKVLKEKGLSVVRRRPPDPERKKLQARQWQHAHSDAINAKRREEYRRKKEENRISEIKEVSEIKEINENESGDSSHSSSK